MADIILVGAGCHAKLIIAAARLSGISIRAIYDDDSALWGSTEFGAPCIGPVQDAPKLGIPALLGCDDPARRKALDGQLELRWGTIIHPLAYLDPSAEVGPGSVVLAGAILQADAVVRRHVVVSANVTISHDTLIQDFARLEPGVVLAGFVNVGEGAVLETGALVIPNVNVGAWSKIGPRSVVIRNVADHASVAGLPARTVPQA